MSVRISARREHAGDQRANRRRVPPSRIPREREAGRGIGRRRGGQRRVFGHARRELLPHREKAESGQHRQQHRCGEQRVMQPLVSAAAREREVQSQAAVQPTGRQKCELARPSLSDVHRAQTTREYSGDSS